MFSDELSPHSSLTVWKKSKEKRINDVQKLFPSVSTFFLLRSHYWTLTCAAYAVTTGTTASVVSVPLFALGAERQTRQTLVINTSTIQYKRSWFRAFFPECKAMYYSIQLVWPQLSNLRCVTGSVFRVSIALIIWEVDDLKHGH